MKSFLSLEQALGYTFKDKLLLQIALTHRSAHKINNERLEFLGDSVLGLVIAEYLYHQYPSLQEGRLSRLRSNLVRGDTLTNVAKSIQLNRFLILGPGEIKSGGQNRASILADVLEAIIGAIAIDSDLTTCKTFILSWFKDALTTLDPNSINKDAKTLLQEWLQAKGQPLPIYEVVSSRGADHCKEFTVQCQVPKLQIVVKCTGRSHRIAEQKAAANALKALKNITDLVYNDNTCSP